MREDPAEQASRLQRSAAELHGRHRWAEAEALAGRAAALLDDQPDGPGISRILHALAATFDGLGDHAGAEALYRRAGTILSTLASNGPDDVLRIRCARGLAATLRRQGRADEASVILVSALALAEQLLGPSHGDTLAVMAALGLLSEDLSRTDDAEELFRQALARAEAAPVSDPDEVAGIAASLSGLLERRQRLAAPSALTAVGYRRPPG